MAKGMTIQKISRAAGYVGLAKDLLTARLTSSQQVRDRAQRHLCERMGQLRGLPQKLGQMMSFGAMAESSGKSSHYASLQESAEPLPWSTMRSVLQESWQCDPDGLIAEVDPVGHAASLGQVHRARLVDGREVAIKVQYPGIRQAVETDLQALGLLSLPLGGLQRGFDLAAYRGVIGKDLQLELDYRIEASNQREFLQQWAGNTSVVVPEPTDYLCSNNVLVSSWESGEHWDEVRTHWPVADRRRLAVAMLQMFLHGIFRHGLMQADWHPGNFRFRRGANGVQVVLYDFGCFCAPTSDERLALARLIQATIGAGEAPWPLLLKLGFHAEYLDPLATKLPAVCRVLFEPFCHNQPYDLADWKLSERLADILGDDRWNFRIAGPAGLIFVVRAFHGLIYYLSGLNAHINWQECFHEAVEPLQLQMAGLTLPRAENAIGFASLARHLKVRVTEAGTTKVLLTYPASHIERLRELLGDDLQTRIAEAGIDLQKIVCETRQKAYAPGPVCNLELGNKRVSVSLE